MNDRSTSRTRRPGRTDTATCATGLVSLIASAFLATSGSAQPLPEHPDIVRGELANGLDYVILSHGTPKDRVQMYLNISSGSLNETQETRGLAHFLEHMAFNGGQNFAPGEVVPFFESIGLTFGRDQNAYTSFNETVYTLELPDTEVDTLDKGLLFFQDVQGGLLLDETEIEAERQVILNEERTGYGPQRRIFDQIFEKIAPGSIVGERLPIGTPETISSVGRDDFLSYYERFYTSNNTTFIAVADMEPWIVVDALERYLGEGIDVPPPADADPNVRSYDESFAIVATDKELTSADVAIVTVDRPAAAVTTVEGLRRELVVGLARAAFNRRLDRLIAEDKVSFRSGGVSETDLADTISISQVSVAGGDGENWRRMLDELAFEYQRARLHGFTALELLDARRELIAGYEQFADTEDTLPASVHINRINAAVSSGDTLMSGGQRLELAREIVREIEASEISEAFAEAFPDDRVAVVLELPEGEPRNGWIPSEADALAALREALDVEPEPWTDAERASALMEVLPESGPTVEITHHAASDVWSAWLSNGTRLHYRYMDERENFASVSISVAGGTLFEVPTAHGLTEASGIAFSRPATRSLSSTQISDLMTGLKAGFAGNAGGDTLQLSVTGNPDDFDMPMQLAHLMLTEPLIEAPAFNQWKQGRRQQIRQSALVPAMQIPDALMRTILTPKETRFFPIDEPTLDGITVERTQNWLEDLLIRGPIEVAIVGDISRERAFDLAEQYVGSLPERGRISLDFRRSSRRIALSEQDRVTLREIDTQTEQAFVIVGSMGPDSVVERKDTYPIRLATQTLSSRMLKTIREEEQLVYSINASSVAVPGFEDMGLVFSVGMTDPERSDMLADRIDDMFTDFVINGPTAEEVDVAYGQTLNTLDEQIERAAFWSGVLKDLTYHDRDLDDVLGYREIYGSYTPEAIREVFASYYTDGEKFRVIIRPTSSAEPEEAAPVEATPAEDVPTGE
ncbi:MAG: insulinase family protein [Planctomycetota bacterium]